MIDQSSSPRIRDQTVIQSIHIQNYRQTWTYGEVETGGNASGQRAEERKKKVLQLGTRGDDGEFNSELQPISKQINNAHARAAQQEWRGRSLKLSKPKTSRCSCKAVDLWRDKPQVHGDHLSIQVCPT
jgi:hypothetical protein